MKNFTFNTGVTLANNPNGPIGGTISPNGVWVIPFEVTEDLPNGSQLMFLSSSEEADGTHSFRRVPVVKPSAMMSDYAFFRVPKAA